MKNKTLSLIAVGAMLTLGLAGCSAAEESEQEDKAPVSEESTPQEAPEAENETETATGDSPEWAEGALDVGESLGEFSTDSWSVEVFQVGTAKTTKDSMFVDKESGENLLPSGAEVVYVNFVVTNTSDADIQLGHSLSSASLEAADWQYMGGQPSFSDSATYESFKLSNDGLQTGADAPFIVGPGQSFAQATNIKYVAGQKVVAEVRITPVDDAGDLLHDDKEQAEAELTIK